MEIPFWTAMILQSFESDRRAPEILKLIISDNHSSKVESGKL